jgi:threonine dehydrogenase-like Zn-dependent dehydrogenase
MEISLDDLSQDEFDIMEELFKTIEPAIKSGKLQQKDHHRAHPISVNPSTFKMKCRNCGNDDYCEDCNNLSPFSFNAGPAPGLFSDYMKDYFKIDYLK